MLAIRIALPHRHSGNSVDPGKNKRAKVDMTILAEKAANYSIAAMHKPRFLYNLNWASGFQATDDPGLTSSRSRATPLSSASAGPHADLQSGRYFST